MIQRVYLTCKEIFSNRFISLIVFFSIIISVFSVSLFKIVGNNFDNYVKNRFASSIPPNTIKVAPVPPRTVFFFQFKDPDAVILNEKALKKIRNISGINRIYPVMLARIPMQARISFFGFHYRTDMLSLGIPYKLIYRDIRGRNFKRMWKKPDFENTIAVLLPKSVLQAYNNGMAGPNLLPRVSEKGTIGLKFRVRFGHSSIRSVDEFTEVDAVIAGFTDKINALALLIPLKVAEYYNKKFNDDNSHREYLYAFINVKDHKSLISVSSKIKKMGFVAEVEKSLSRQIINLKKNVNLFINSFMYFIIILSIIAISFSTVIATLNRIEYYRILRILGSSRMFITFTIIVKYIILGFAGSYAGLFLIELLAGYTIGFMNLSALKISLILPEHLYKKIILAGTIIPALSTIPGLFRLYSKGLGRD